MANTKLFIILLATSCLTTAHAREINVADFGALPDDKDDTRAIKAAFPINLLDLVLCSF